MASNRLVIASGLGTYLTGGKPRAATTSFLYYEPSALLWADKLLCDPHALEGERTWASQGVLISDVFSRLADTGIVESHRMDRYFTSAVREVLTQVSEYDRSDAPLSDKFFPTVTIDPDRASPTYNGFLDINSHLFVCAKLGASFLEETNTAPYYKWKMKQVVRREQAKGQAVFARVIGLRMPSLSLFPRNRSFQQTRVVTKKLFEAFQHCCTGQMPLSKYKRIYDDALTVFESYERPIRHEVLDNLAQIIELRGDTRLKSLRRQMDLVAKRVTVDVEDKRFTSERDLELKRALLEAEGELAEDPKYEWFEKLESFVSPPISLAALAGGSAASVVTQNPVFMIAGAMPTAAAWTSRVAKVLSTRRTAWYSYLVDADARLGRAAHLRNINRRLKNLRQPSH